MKLSEKLKEKLKKDFHYSDLTDKDWDSEWVLDNKWKPYYKEKKCICLRNNNDSWLELSINDYLCEKTNTETPNYGEVLSAVQSIIDLMYNSNFDPTINYLEEFEKLLFEMRD